MNKKLNELRAKLATLKAAGQSKVEALKALEAEIAKLEAAGEAEAVKAKKDALAALEAESDKICDDIEATLAAINDIDRRVRRAKLFGATAPAALAAAMTVTSAELDPARTAGFRSMADFGRAVRAASPGPQHTGLDPRLVEWMKQAQEAQHRELEALRAAGIMAAPTNYHQEGGTTEGYMVPPEFRDTIWALIAEADEPDLLMMTDLEPTTSNQVDMIADESTPWGSSGIQANWKGEAAQLTTSKLTTQGRTTRLGELYAFVAATEELLEDAPRLNDRLTVKSAAAINWKASDAVMNGDGVGKPMGILNAASLVTVAKDGAQTAKTITFNNVSDMTGRMLGGSFARSVWLVNPDALPQIHRLNIGGFAVWTPLSAGAQYAPAGLLLGRPLIPTEHQQTLGTVGDIVLADLRGGYYAARKANGITFASSMHLYFDYNMTAFRWTFRVGGQPYLSAPVSPAHGSTKKSHFVALATRA